jgi:hypothetical protein
MESEEMGRYLPSWAQRWEGCCSKDDRKPQAANVPESRRGT